MFERHCDAIRNPSMRLGIVKLAIIDDGVDIGQIDGQVVAGISFTLSSADRVRPYFISTFGRGTKIASLAHLFYPDVKLLVAKIDDTFAAAAKVRTKMPVLTFRTTVARYSHASRLSNGLCCMMRISSCFQAH